jgi:hypothetical protein
VFPHRHELALDNDCILWDVPCPVGAWLAEETGRCLIAADVVPAFGVFAAVTRPEPRNTGIRGLPPGHDLGAALLEVLRRHPARLASELDEQGLQAAALDLGRPAHVVPIEEVTICSPFWPHQPRLGRAGAHFVGLNARALPWDWHGRPASEVTAENFAAHRAELAARVGLPSGNHHL